MTDTTFETARARAEASEKVWSASSTMVTSSSPDAASFRTVRAASRMSSSCPGSPVANTKLTRRPSSAIRPRSVSWMPIPVSLISSGNHPSARAAALLRDLL